MIMRSKISVAIGLSCLTGAVLAGSAAAKDGDRGGKSGIEVEVRGLVTALTPETATAGAAITVAPGGTLAPWTCTLRTGSDTTGVVVNTTTVKMKCRDRGGVLTAKRIRTTDDTTGRVKLKAAGLVTAFAAATPGTTTTPVAPGSITVNPGTGLPLVTCAITDRTRLRGTPVINTDIARVECRTRDGILVAKKIKVKRQQVTPPYGVANPGTNPGANPGGNGNGGRHHGRGGRD
jgi:hypothetical protein